MAEDAVERQKIYCNLCSGATNHELKARHRQVVEDDPDFGPVEVITYSLWVRAGCDTGTLETSHWGEWMDPDDVECSYEPKRKHSDLSPKRFLKLEPKLAEIYRETIESYNNGSLVLCTAGLRALLEGICDNKRTSGKNLRTKIDGLQKFLPNKNIIKSMHHFRFVGNQALHELEAPDRADVKLAIEVMEDLLNFLYELDYKASRLKAKPRKVKLARHPVAVPPAPAATAGEIQET